jgi:hypothetical protein
MAGGVKQASELGQDQGSRTKSMAGGFTCGAVSRIMSSYNQTKARSGEAG